MLLSACKLLESKHLAVQAHDGRSKYGFRCWQVRLVQRKVLGCRRLELSDNGNSTVPRVIPEDVGELRQLQSLALTGWMVTRLPLALTLLTQLQVPPPRPPSSSHPAATAPACSLSIPAPGWRVAGYFGAKALPSAC